MGNRRRILWGAGVAVVGATVTAWLLFVPPSPSLGLVVAVATVLGCAVIVVAGNRRIAWGAGIAVVGASVTAGLLSFGSSLEPPLVVAVVTVLACGVIVGQTAVDVACGVCHVLLVLAFVGGAVEVNRVADTLGASPVLLEYYGTLDAAGLQQAFNQRKAIRFHSPVVYPSGATEVKVTNHTYFGDAGRAVPSVKQKVLFVVQELLPVSLAIGVLALLAPLLRAARRGRPFGGMLTRRVAALGWLLLIGLPALDAVRFWLASSVPPVGFLRYDSPPLHAAVTFDTKSIVPGLLVLGLAVIFRRGAELQELEEHTV